MEKSLNARISAVPYLVYLRVLNRNNLGISIDARTYYNLVRNTRGNKERQETIEGLLIALNKAGFYFRTRVEDLLDKSGDVINRKLLQIWFIYLTAVRLV